VATSAERGTPPPRRSHLKFFGAQTLPVPWAVDVNKSPEQTAPRGRLWRPGFGPQLVPPFTHESNQCPYGRILARIFALAIRGAPVPTARPSVRSSETAVRSCSRAHR
jgi:hypothetical protein